MSQGTLDEILRRIKRIENDVAQIKRDVRYIKNEV